MSTRCTWLLGVLILISVGLLVACGSHFSASSDGLVIVPSQGSAVLQAFSFALNNGHTSQINTAPSTNGTPTAVLLDPAGSFAYVLVNQNTIATFKVSSNGTLSSVGTTGFNPASVTVPGAANPESVPVVPAALAMDSVGKFLFVADRETSDSAHLSVPGGISVFSVGSNAALTEVAGSPFFPTPPVAGSAPTDMVALAPTPVTFPTANAVCTNQNAPTAEYLYVADSLNNQVWDFAVDMSSGALAKPAGDGSVPVVAAGSVPAGIAVDACGRFVYVANQNSNNVSAYSICTKVQIPTCLNADDSLVPIGGSPFNALTNPGPIVVDPFGNTLYVVNQGSNSISTFRISPVTGSLTTSGAGLATGANPVSIAIRSDDQWLFVTNNGSSSVTEYAITPASGALAPAGAGITTDNLPFGLAVK
jgi:6-phosphogluconolactonase (cycloisomerase 2 family)